MKDLFFNPKKIIESIPRKPGVYQYYDKHSVLIYIGKAKDLKNRVSSYFNSDNQQNAKTKTLVKQINEIKFTIVDTEIDAWLLENSLIKKYQPKYNILLKDDKTYPSICIKKERFPRVFPVRNIIKDGSTYYGPYASVTMMKTVLDLTKNLFPLRNCNLNLTQANIDAGKFKVCLEYQIGNCKGPCQNFQTEEDYNYSIKNIKEILKGNIKPVLEILKRQLKEFVLQMKFENAQIIKSKIELLETYQSKSTIVNPSLNDIDVFSIASDEKYAFINYIKVINGTINQTQTVEYKKKLDESDSDILSLAIIEFREKFQSSSKEIIVPIDLGIENSGLDFFIPKIGDKRKLLDLSLKNVLFFKREKLNQYDKLNPEHRTERILLQLQTDLRLNQLPKHIECFDNSNFQGKNPVSAMVVFRDAKPSKKEYRHYHVKSVVGPNDFASMEEVVFRRYKRLLEEGVELPQMILIDGGKGQLSSAIKSLKKLGLESKISIISIAKKLEELYYPNDPIPLHLDKKSESLKILQQLRDEAHRFGITFHRNLRIKGSLKSELSEIPGIGKASIEKLLKRFKSVVGIQKANMEDLLKIVDKNKTEKILTFFKEKQINLNLENQKND